VWYSSVRGNLIRLLIPPEDRANNVVSENLICTEFVIRFMERWLSGLRRWPAKATMRLIAVSEVRILPLSAILLVRAVMSERVWQFA
jgi:hypothetical protein